MEVSPGLVSERPDDRNRRGSRGWLSRSLSPNAASGQKLVPRRCLPLWPRTRTLFDAVGTSHLCRCLRSRQRRWRCALQISQYWRVLNQLRGHPATESLSGEPREVLTLSDLDDRFAPEGSLPSVFDLGPVKAQESKDNETGCRVLIRSAAQILASHMRASSVDSTEHSSEGFLPLGFWQVLDGIAQRGTRNLQIIALQKT